MAYRSIFTVVTAPIQAATTIPACADLCAAQNAHLDVLAVGIDRVQTGYGTFGGETVLMELTLAQATKDAQDNFAAAEAALGRPAPGLRWSLDSAVAQAAMVNDLVVAQARFADLVVLSSPYAPGAVGSGADAVLEAVLFQAHTPVLVLPTEGAAPVLPPRRIVLGWDQSAAAMAATRAALPLLIGAETVVITIVDPGAEGAERSDPGGLLCQMLVRHGVRAEVSVLARTLPRTADVLARQVTDVNADLLVMGGYGHSRLREAILGGATRDTLQRLPVPVLMAH